MEVDLSRWSGEGEFTQAVVDALRGIDEVAHVRVEDAPATRSEADYNFISNEVYVLFRVRARQEAVRRWGIIPAARTVQEKTCSIGELETSLSQIAHIGPPDYSDEGMLQYLRTERIVPPYQTRGYKLVELVRIYEATEPRR
jgi:hypothetical protein